MPIIAKGPCSPQLAIPRRSNLVAVKVVVVEVVANKATTLAIRTGNAATAQDAEATPQAGSGAQGASNDT